MYKFKIVSKDGQEEVNVGRWPNQRDARKYAIRSSLMVMSGRIKAKDCVAIPLDDNYDPPAYSGPGARPEDLT